MPDKSLIEAKIRKITGKKLFKHVLGVAQTAERLAGMYGADVDKAGTAALLHDCAKDMSRDEMNRAVKKYGIKITKHEREIPAIWHGLIAGAVAEREFGIRDRQVLAAIKNHSTGRPNMRRLEKIIYVADFIEPGRKYRDSTRIARSLKKVISLDRLVSDVVKAKVKYLRRKNLKVHRLTLKLLGKSKNM